MLSQRYMHVHTHTIRICIAVGLKRVVVDHDDDNDILKIKAGLLDLEYEIGGEPIPTNFMGFAFTDGCAWHSDNVSLCQTKVSACAALVSCAAVPLYAAWAHSKCVCRSWRVC